MPEILIYSFIIVWNIYLFIIAWNIYLFIYLILSEIYIYLLLPEIYLFIIAWNLIIYYCQKYIYLLLPEIFIYLFTTWNTSIYSKSIYSYFWITDSIHWFVLEMKKCDLEDKGRCLTVMPWTKTNELT